MFFLPTILLICLAFKINYKPYSKVNNKQIKLKKQKTHFEEAEKASKPDSDTAGMLELSDQEFKITVINKVMALMDK